jgi:hypothetical protein
MSAYKYLFVETTPYEAGYENPEDFPAEFVQEARIALCSARDECEDEAEGARLELLSADVLIVRCSRAEDVDVYDMADAHSGEAEQVAAYLRGRGDDEFYDLFDKDPEYADVLLIDDLSYEKSYEPTTDLVFVRQEDDLLAQHFRGFFKTDGPFLIYSKAHFWPKPAPEPVVTVTGGQA